jgi:hypothetical protein
MNRLFLFATFFLLALSAGAADRFARDPEQISMATTARILKIDAKNKTFKVRGSDAQNLSGRSVAFNLSQVMQGLKQRIGVTLPGGITIALPGRNKTAVKPSDPKAAELDEYTVAVTNDTVFQDGGDSVRFDDFKTGEVISIHGVLTGNTITASRIAKWF